MSFLIKKQSFKKLTVILRVTGKLLLKSKDTCLNEIFELTILTLTFVRMFFLKIYNVDKLKRNDIRSQLLPYYMTGKHDSVSLYLSNDLFQWLENEH
jgi:hypothetical protein